MTILTEKEIKNTLDIGNYRRKYNKALEFAESRNDTLHFWTNVREYFLALGGCFIWQK